MVLHILYILHYIDTDSYGNWKVLLDNLSTEVILSTLLFRYLITPRQYTEIASMRDEADRQAAIGAVLVKKGKAEWQIFVASLRDSGFGDVFDDLYAKQRACKFKYMHIHYLNIAVIAYLHNLACTSIIAICSKTILQ